MKLPNVDFYSIRRWPSATRDSRYQTVRYTEVNIWSDGDHMKGGSVNPKPCTHPMALAAKKKSLTNQSRLCRCKWC